MSSPLLGFCTGLHLAATLCAMPEDLGELQPCRPSMVSPGSKNLPPVSEVRLTRRRGRGVWDEEEQPHNVPHFCWKYIDASEHSGRPWDAWLRAEAAPDPVACMRALGLSQSMMLSTSSPWLLAALWLHQSACVRCSLPIGPSQAYGFYGEGSREGSCSASSSLCLHVLFLSVMSPCGTKTVSFVS